MVRWAGSETATDPDYLSINEGGRGESVRFPPILKAGCSRRLWSAHRGDYGMAATLITEDSLVADGWSIGTLFASKLLPPIDDGAIIELRVMPHDNDIDGWSVGLVQGVPDDPTVADDHVELTCGRFRTMSQLRWLIRALCGSIATADEL